MSHWTREMLLKLDGYGRPLGVNDPESVIQRDLAKLNAMTPRMDYVPTHAAEAIAVKAIDALFTEYEKSLDDGHAKVDPPQHAITFDEGRVRAAVEIREAVIRALRSDSVTTPTTKGPQR